MPTKVVKVKLKIFLALVAVIFIILISRLGYLQLIQTEQFKTMSEQNRIKFVSIPAPRGEIRTRDGKVLVKDRPVYSVSIVYLGLKNQEEVVKKLAAILGMDPKEINAAINDANVRKFEPIKIKKDVPLDIVTKIEERRQELPGVEINVEPMRQYVYGNFAPHILGYIQEIKKEQLEAKKNEGYNLGDRYGQAGLENTYESVLRGVDGDRQVEVDRNQHPVRELDIRPPVAGNNLILNIDFNVQKAAEEALDRVLYRLQTKGTDKKYPNARAGAVVLLDVRTGKVLAMASKPGFDPNIFNGKITKAQSEALFSPNNPFPAFNNRAMMPYAPGSTFKMVTATAVLETKKARPSDTIYDSGSVFLYGRSYKCWRPSGHGRVDLVKAIQVSCNVYFYQMGLRAKVENIAKYALQYGLGQKTGIDLPGEKTGRVPTPEWKRQLNEGPLKAKYEKKYKAIEEKYDKLIANAQSERERKSLERKKESELRQKRAQYKIDKYWLVDWREFETVIMAIGQGDNLYTPLQMANYIATIANGGIRYKPYIVDKITDYQGRVVKQNKPEVMQKVDVSPQTLAVIRRGMAAVTEPGGTAASVFAGFPIKVAGKTGTAQTGKDPKTGLERDNHGWFVGFAPYDNPQVAVAAIVEYGGHGGSSAGYVARDVLAAYFKVKQQQNNSGRDAEE
ncbi:penicillin-binding protein 2 [Thermincola ferriacetica]|uniref:Penicillin-binding protein 2 n=1 Tax=Thermincola ferriacetica TaxID=281456 RepID=A0A0L6W3A2_9FIRM|nr:penicillin-binding protein 2 [Thermincola ferriacetica]KNZ69564.1 penicillin-binding protein 2 [Thermincola ferriacetica]